MLHLTGLKIFTDGGTCERPALSYELQPGEGFGDLFLEQEELNALVSAGQQAGFQIAIHAIGDRAVEQAQNAIAAALNGQPNTYRHRIEHNSVVRPEMLARYGEIGIIPTVFGLYPQCNPFGLPPPAEYQSWEWPVRAMLEANPGLPVAWHGDDPFFGRIRPLDDLYSFVTRDELTEGGTVCEAPAWHDQHTITPVQALQLMTTNSAYALWRDSEIGQLNPGHYADLIVLTANPLAIDTPALKYLDVRLTMVGGRVEYCAVGQAWLCPQ
jgi:predicted amidohydrolase YtcJ